MELKFANQKREYVKVIQKQGEEFTASKGFYCGKKLKGILILNVKTDKRSFKTKLNLVV